MRATIARWGNSLALRLPKAAAQAAGLAEGDVVDVREDGGDLRIVRHPDLDIEAMIAAITPDNLNVERLFIDVPPVGNELL